MSTWLRVVEFPRPRLVWVPMVVLLIVAAFLVPDHVEPVLRRRVTDLTANLSPQVRDDLEAHLEALEHRKGSQLAVLVVPDTGAETVEAYALRVARSWRLGRSGIDDGVLLLVVQRERRVRIEVGRGLESAIPEDMARRIIEEDMAPVLRGEGLAAGVLAGTRRLIERMEATPLPPPWHPPLRGTFAGEPLCLVLLIIGAMLLLPLLIDWSMAAGIVAAVGLGALVLGLGVLGGNPLPALAMVALLAVITVVVALVQSGRLRPIFLGYRRSGSSSGGGAGGGGGGFSGGGGGFGGFGGSGGW